MIRVWHGIGSLSGGGAEKQLCLLLNQLPADSFRLRVVTVRDAEPSPALPNSVSTLCLPRSHTWRWDQIWLAVQRDLDDFQPDLIHAWLPEVISLPAAFWGWKMRIPVVTSVRRSFFKGIGLRAWGREMLSLLPHLFATEIVSNFPLDHEPAMIKRLLKRKPCRVIRNGVDISPRSDARSAGLPPYPLQMLFVGRFAKQKRLNWLLEAVAAARNRGADLRLDVFGTGTPKAEADLLAQVTRLGLTDRVRFLGYDPDWRRHAANYHMLVFPSSCEGMPNVVVEAMAEGLPVLASDIPELNGIVEEDRTGWRFPVLDRSVLELRLQELSRNPPVSQDWSAKAHSVTNDFSLVRLKHAYQALYSELTSSQNK